MTDLQMDEAISDFTKAINHYCDPTHYHRRGQARLLEENLDGAIEDFSEALNLNGNNEFQTSLIYANRGFAFLLQGNERAAAADFQKGLRIHSGQKVIIELHLRTLESQLKQMRERRIQLQRNVSTLNAITEGCIRAVPQTPRCSSSSLTALRT